MSPGRFPIGCGNRVVCLCDWLKVNARNPVWQPSGNFPISIASGSYGCCPGSVTILIPLRTVCEISFFPTWLVLFHWSMLYIANMTMFALSQLLGTHVKDASGEVAGKVREVALCPQDDRQKICYFILKTRSGDRLLPAKDAELAESTVKARSPKADWQPLSSSAGMLLLERDLLDQQIIDVHGRKVVRVNDVNIQIQAEEI